MQHERHALGRRQRIQHGQQRHADGIGENELVLGVVVIRHRFGFAPDGLFVAHLARAQKIEAHAADDGREPARQVFHGAGIRAGQAQPCFLHRIIRLAARSEHAIGHRAQMLAIGFEFLRQKFRLVHPSHSIRLVRHRDDE